jgi:HEAT repeat protein
MTKKTPVLSLDDLIAGLKDVDKPLPPLYLYRMSDLEGQELNRFKAAWPSIPLWRRQSLLEDMESMADDDMLLSFEAVGQIALQDEDPGVRQRAISVLWDYEDTRLTPKLIDLALKDPAAEVRASAAGALAPYIYLGEIDEIPKRTLHNIEECLLKVMASGDEAAVRRGALEALGYSSRPEVPGLIQWAYDTDTLEWVASALYAMSRSADPSWKEQVLEMLESEAPSLRKEAARAAGELELADATPMLLQMLDDPDQDTRLASAWSLSQLGGEGVLEALQQMYDEAEDDDELDLIESALDNLAFTEDMQTLPFFDIAEDDLEFLEDDEDAPQGEDEEDGDLTL